LAEISVDERRLAVNSFRIGEGRISIISPQRREGRKEDANAKPLLGVLGVFAVK
jgi:hypothetical protein